MFLLGMLFLTQRERIVLSINLHLRVLGNLQDHLRKQWMTLTAPSLSILTLMLLNLHWINMETHELGTRGETMQGNRATHRQLRCKLVHFLPLSKDCVHCQTTQQSIGGEREPRKLLQTVKNIAISMSPLKFLVWIKEQSIPKR